MSYIWNNLKKIINNLIITGAVLALIPFIIAILTFIYPSIGTQISALLTAISVSVAIIIAIIGIRNKKDEARRSIQPVLSLNASPFDFVEYITACGVSGKNPLIQLSSKFKEVVKMDVGNIMHQAFIPDINYFLPLIQDSKNIGKEYAYADIEISNCGNGNLQNLRIESVSNDKRGEDSIWINGDSLCITDRRRFLLQIDCSNFTQEKTCPIHICAKFDDCNNHHYRQEFTFNVEYPTEPHYKTHNTSIIRKTIEVHADPVIQC